MDPEIAEFARSFRAFTKAMTRAAKAESSELTKIGEHVQDFLGVDVNEIEPVTETFPGHQVVDIDIALEFLLAELSGTRYGISGPRRAEVETLSEYLTHSRRRVRARLGGVRTQSHRPGHRPPGGRLRPRRGADRRRAADLAAAHRAADVRAAAVHARGDVPGHARSPRRSWLGSGS